MLDVLFYVDQQFPFLVDKYPGRIQDDDFDATGSSHSNLYSDAEDNAEEAEDTGEQEIHPFMNTCAW